MKTRVKVFLAALLALMLLKGWSVLAENNEGKSYPDRFPESRAFDSRWRADNKVLEAVGESDGFRITITEKVSPREEVRWEYSAVYDPEKAVLETVWDGRKIRAFLGTRGESEGTVVEAENCVGIFSIDPQGRLIWTDEKENGGDGLAFEKIGRFDGTYASDRASVDITWNLADGYTVYMEWADSAFENTAWNLRAEYIGQTGELHAAGTQTHYVYGEDGEILRTQEAPEEARVIFTLDEGGILTWQDAQDQKAAGVQFTYLGPVTDNG